MKILDNGNCIYCKDSDSTIHALLECPYTAHLWRHVVLCLRRNVDTTIKISDKEKKSDSMKDIQTHM